MTIGGDAFLGDPSVLHPGNAAAAIILTPDDRYLLQLRDPKPGIFFPNCWGCFGGGVSPPDEGAQDCLRREIEEELGIALGPDEVSYFSNFTFDLSFCSVGVIYRTFYEVRLSERQFSSVVLGEGAAMRAFGRAALPTLRLTPYDAFALWLHDNRRRLSPAPIPE